MGYRLSRKAEDDLIALYLVGAQTFGPAQAERYFAQLQDAFDFIAQFPKAAGERTEIDPPVRILPHKAHLIVYLIEDRDDVLILRIRHGSEDWAGYLP
ncbi:MAG TPA: type II toxin-antitoxin system RelE/ParE family toxin [Caulobacteraceae bacterium]|nr:type II toxin-antitoxin system RelE/ParE family toxin [Caulobacteraceae bacterium]